MWPLVFQLFLPKKQLKTILITMFSTYIPQTAVPTTSRPPIKSSLTGSASERVNSSAGAETGPSLQGRKRLRVPDSGVEIETNASEQRMVQFSTKTASGTKQTFHFTSSSRPGELSHDLNILWIFTHYQKCSIFSLSAWFS